jgi:hypothetical protein
MITHYFAVPADASCINLRPEDDAEARLYGRGEPEEVLALAIRQSARAFTSVDDQGRVIAIWGLAESLDGFHPWLMCSALVQNHRASVLRIAKRIVAECLTYDRLIFNFVSKDAHAARAFIRHLGFRIVRQRGPFDLFYHPESCVSSLPPSP